jgi:hypothetical protein
MRYPGETKNLYKDARLRDICTQLQQRLEAQMRAIADPILRAHKP